jgi:DNA (cytosine-5)-methyltransferase 1
MKKSLKAVDFFCGGGGFTCGLKKAGIEVLLGIDIDGNCEETYKKNNNVQFLKADIKSLQLNELEKYSVKKNDDDLIFIGCSPCQYWSIISTDKNKSKESKNLVEDFFKFVDYYRPGFLIIENVPGLASHNESPIKCFQKKITEIGYTFKTQILNASDFGVAQNRKRFILIASRITSDIDLIKPTTKTKKTVRDVLGESNGFNTIEAGFRDESELQHSCAGLSEKCIERLKLTPKDGGNRLSWSTNPRLQLKTYIGKDDSFKDSYGRMFWDKPSPTITTKFFSISNGRFAHPEEDRAISIREGATLQSFPKNYKFYASSMAAQARIVGNAVPPLLSKAIGKHLLSYV